ncbi:GNAT family N-acetyltransferase [Nocardia sp. NPDC004568]|uniref:GNAT family N-acetyltransferase n=1 Tax=Nocardia sp. NPDC004568 TaxID=3154551 RepID=UPI0033BA2F75
MADPRRLVQQALVRITTALVDGVTHIRHRNTSGTAGRVHKAAHEWENLGPELAKPFSATTRDRDQVDRAAISEHDSDEFVGPLPSSAATAHTPNLETKLLTPDDWRVRREVVLAKLRESPDHYKTRYETAAARTEQQWRDMITSRTSVFTVFRDGKPVGELASWPSTDHPDAQEIHAVWVDPTARRSGASDQLMQTQLQWLERHGHPRMVLWTREDNTPMQSLAERHGFTRTGNTRARSGGGIPSVEMGRNLTSDLPDSH